jgi:Ca2+-binding EF-hand superfamily protein
MMSVSGSYPSGIDPSHMKERMQEKFQNADVDGNHSLSKTEAKDLMLAKGIDGANLGKVFSRMDADGNGEISRMEQKEAHMSHMQRRMENLTGDSEVGIENTNTGKVALEGLLESLKADLQDPSKRSEIHVYLQRLRTEGHTEQNVAESAALINSVVPSINTAA